MKTTKITKTQLEKIVLEETLKQKKIIKLEEKKRKLQEEIQKINEERNEKPHKLHYVTYYELPNGKWEVPTDKLHSIKYAKFNTEQEARDYISKNVKKDNSKKSIKENQIPQQNQVKEQPRESIFDAKPGETLILNFEGITIKVKRQLDDLFKVTDAADSAKLEDGDYIRAQGNDVLENGRKFKFSILRKIPVDYETRPLSSWKIIKN